MAPGGGDEVPDQLLLVQREVGFAQSALANARGRSFTATRAVPREEDILSDALAAAGGAS